MSRKHKLFCRCGQEIHILRARKGHKHYVCPVCGIVATNPLPLAALAIPAAKVAASTVGSWLAWKGLDKISGGKTKQWSPPEGVPEGDIVAALKSGLLSTFEKAILAELADRRR